MGEGIQHGCYESKLCSAGVFIKADSVLKECLKWKQTGINISEFVQ
jgi:hypothetical protein